MASRRYRAPFHRRILPWVFVIIFLALAPAVVFYTAGYRYNPKKGVIERNGTLIVDSKPKGAEISLNGGSVPDQSPVTLQNVAPGTYTITLKKSGFHSWEKTLEIRPERVTFANHIQLWKESEPELVSTGTASILRASQSGRYLAALAHEMAELRIYDLSNGSSETMTFPSPVSSTKDVTLEWDDAETAVLISDAAGLAWVAVRGSKMQALPKGWYRWDGGILVGVLPGELLSYTVSSGEIRRTPLLSGIRDEQSGYRIVMHGEGLGLVEIRRPERVFALPTGDWRFTGVVRGYPFVTDGERWLGVDTLQKTTNGLSFHSKVVPELIQKTGNVHILSRRGGELWMTNVGKDTELLVRKSQDITGAAWHREGEHVFYSTQQSVIALELDPRDGRIGTELAHFDDIQALSEARAILYISGARGDTEGIWRLEVE